MSAAHDPRKRESVLDRVAAGELDPADAEVAECVAADPAFARAVREAAAVARDLEEVLARREEDLALADDLTDERDLDRVRTGLRRASGDAGGGGGAFRRVGWVAAVVAAAVVAFVVWPRDEWESLEPRRDGRTLGAPVEAVAPLGPDADFSSFRWTDPGESGSWYRVVVTDAGDGSAVASSADLQETAWNPDDTDGWPARIEWRVEVLDDSGRWASSPAFSASR